MREMLRKAERRRERWKGRSCLFHWEEVEKRRLYGPRRA